MPEAYVQSREGIIIRAALLHSCRCVRQGIKISSSFCGSPADWEADKLIIQKIWGLIYKACGRTKWGQKQTCELFCAKGGIYRNQTWHETLRTATKALQLAYEQFGGSGKQWHTLPRGDYWFLRLVKGPVPLRKHLLMTLKPWPAYSSATINVSHKIIPYKYIGNIMRPKNCRILDPMYSPSA